MGKGKPQFPWAEGQIKEGRGQGVGKDYRPWIHVRDFSSLGKSSRLKSWKSGRTIQLVSGIETAFAYLLEWSDAVVDYYEQYPLLPLEETLELATALGIRHPIDGKTKEPRVRTTDFLIQLRLDGDDQMRARSIKPADDLKVKSKVLGLELERRFWSPRQIDWAIVTERDLPSAMVKNIEWIHDARTLDDHVDIAALPLEEILPLLRKAIDAGDLGLSHSCLAVDSRVGLEGGSCLFLVRHQLATKAWRTDMNQAIKTQQPLLLLPTELGQLTERGAA